MGKQRDLTVRFRGCPGDEALVAVRRVFDEAELTLSEEVTAANETRVVYEPDPRFGSVRAVAPGDERGFDLRLAATNQSGPLAWLRAVTLFGRAFTATALEWGTTRPGYTPRGPGRRTVREADPAAVGTVAFFDPETAAAVGEDRLRSAPAFARRELADGGLVLVASLEPDTDRVDTVREYLANPGSVPDEPVLDEYSSHRDFHDVYRLPSYEGEPRDLPDRLDTGAVDDVLGVLAIVGAWDRDVADAELWTDTERTAARLESLLTDEPRPIRREAAWALWVGAREGFDAPLGPLLRRASDDDSASVRSIALEGLRQLATDDDRSPSATAGSAVLNLALSDPDPGVRATAVRTLPDYVPDALEEERVLETCRTVFETDPSPIAREGAVSGTAEVTGDGRLPLDLDLLFEAFEDEARRVRETAADEFPSIPTSSARSSISREKLEGLSETVKAHEDRVLRLVDADELAVRATAVNLVVFLESDEAAAILERAARDDHEAVRKAAACAYSLVDPETAVDGLLPFLSDESTEVRRKTAFLIYKYAELRPEAFAPALPALIDLLEEPAGQVGKWASRAIGEISEDRGVEIMLERLGNGDPNQTRNATEALGKIGDDRAVEPLRDYLDEAPWNLQIHVVKALDRIGGEEAREALREAAESAYPDARERAQEALDQYENEATDE